MQKKTRTRIWSILLCMVMLLSLLPVTALADGTGVTGLASDEAAIALGMTARIGEAGSSATYYSTLWDAVNAVEPEGTVYLITDAEGQGIGTYATPTATQIHAKDFTIDFGGHTYTCFGPAVGSTGYESQAFHLECSKDQSGKYVIHDVTLKNGKINAVAGSGVQMLIQNYSNLTLEDMELDGTTAIWGYTVSNNCGATIVTGNTKIIAPTGGIALDVCDFSNYPGVSVTFDESFTGTVSGPIEYSGTDKDKDKLVIESTEGTFEEIVLATTGNTSGYESAVNAGAIAVSGGNFSSVLPAAYCATGVMQLVDEDGNSQVLGSDEVTDKGYLQVDSEAGIYYTSEEAVAQYNEAKVESGRTTYYTTLEDAIAAVTTTSPSVDAPATITLLKDVEITSMPSGDYEFFALPANTILDGGGKSITVNVPNVSGYSSLYHVLGVNSGKVQIKNLEIFGDYTAGSSYYCTRAGIHAYEGAEVAINNVKISGCGSVAVQVNGSTVTADGLTASDNNWGSVNVDMGRDVTTIPAFTFNSGDLQDTAQIYTELTDKIQGSETAEDYKNVITLGPNSGLIPNPVVGVGGDIDGKLYYTNDHAKLGEALNETTGKIYVDLDTAITAAANGNRVVVVKNAKVDTTTTAIPEGVTLVVSRDVTLTIQDELTNNGTIENNGTIDGEENIKPGATGSTKVAVTFAVNPSTASVTVTGASPVEGNSKVFLLDSGKNYAYTVSASGYYTKTDTVTVGNDAKTVTVELTQVPTTPSYTGGGSSSSSGNYAVNVESGKNGTVSVSPSRADKGDTVTITVKPSTGYELDTLTVTDKDGDSVKLTYKSANKYTFTMPGSKVTIKATFAEISEDLPFTDVAASAWYADAVQFVYENGLMTGVTTTSFGPNVTTSRAMLATILYRLEGEPSVGSSDFTDVESGMYYTDAVAWASSKGIVTGYGDGTFLPNKAITREEMAAMLYRYASYKGYDVTNMKDLSGYSDAASVSSYAVEALQWATGEGLVTNMDDGTLTPAGPAVRAQIATILMRFLGE